MQTQNALSRSLSVLGHFCSATWQGGPARYLNVKGSFYSFNLPKPNDFNVTDAILKTYLLNLIIVTLKILHSGCLTVVLFFFF